MGAMHATGASALGVPLEPGERVVYYQRPNYRAEKTRLVVIGLLTLIVGVGVLFLALALFYDRLNPRAQIVTDRRVIVVDGAGRAKSTALADIADVEAFRQNTRYGASSLLGVAVGAAAAAIANRRANQHDKRSLEYWAHTVVVVAVVRDGRRVGIRTRDGLTLGPLLARCVLSPGFAAQLPGVAAPA